MTQRLIQFSKPAFAAALFAACAFGLSPARATEVRPMFKAGYDIGGDTLLTVVFTNGSTQSIKGNQGLFFGGGMLIRSDSGDMETEVSLSYKFSTITAGNGSVTWSRMPLDVIVFLRQPALRFGGGITYHMGPEVSGTGVLSGTATIDNSLGFLMQVDFPVGRNMQIGGRYTILDYTVGGTSFNASGLGFTFSMNF